MQASAKQCCSVTASVQVGFSLSPLSSCHNRIFSSVYPAEMFFVFPRAPSSEPHAQMMVLRIRAIHELTTLALS